MTNTPTQVQPFYSATKPIEYQLINTTEAFITEAKKQDTPPVFCNR